MDVNLTISLIKGQMGTVIEKAVNVAVETVLGEMIRVVGLKFEEIKREMSAKDKENENIRKMLETHRGQMKTMRKYISVLATKDPNRLYQGDEDMTLHCRRGPTSSLSMCAKAPNPCPRPRVTEPVPVAGPSWVRQQMHISNAHNLVQEPLRTEHHLADLRVEEMQGSSVHKVDNLSHHLVDSQGLLCETSDPIWGQNPLKPTETEHTDMPHTNVHSAHMMTDDPTQTTTTQTVAFGATSLKIKQEEAEVEIVCVKDEHSEAAGTSRFEYSNHELHQPLVEPERGVSLDIPGSFQALQSPGTSAELANPAFISVDPTSSFSDARQLSPGSFEANQCTRVERAILESQGEMDMKINHLTALVQSFMGNRRLALPLLMEDEQGDCVLPLTSMEDLDRLERRLMDRSMMQKLVNRLSISGGQTMKKTIWRICNKVFSSSVAKQLNWCGRGDKRGIRRTNIGVLIIAAAMRNNGLLAPNEAEAEKCIKDYLRLAPGRASF
ncbi:uncharacterized protein si:ch211-67e16.4 isoform X1 [Xyrauchen texanus]|uniref:uncharacterized protein si:ch211-67e16.4 isoform X1 n=1 Tax=Xyrauchen texanus TaxID=154827 RepID=UPI0022425D38|nr:uncharacterized protein si:ch211-67e16.4 isoform X1 [Xyrauchen texanus]